MAKKRKRHGHRLEVGERDAKRQHQTQAQSEANNPVGSRLLSFYYPHVYTLGEYLLQKVDKNSSFDQRISQLDGDDALLKLLQTSLVGAFQPRRPADLSIRIHDYQDFSQRPNASPNAKRHTSGGVSNSLGDGSAALEELVNFTVWRLFARDYRQTSHPPHVLCNGFLRADSSKQASKLPPADEISGLVVQYSNSNVTKLKSEEWARLLQMMGKGGDFVLLDLWTDCGLYVSLEAGKGNYLQVSGVNLAELPLIEKLDRASLAKQETLGPRVDLSKPLSPRQCSNIAFVRNRMFYARAALNSRGEVRFGMRHIHVLNRFTDHKNHGHAVQIMKYIFPRQFGLHNVFSSKVDRRETSYSFKDYTIREAEIDSCQSQRNLGSIPKRLRGQCLRLIHKLQAMHNRCGYKELLKYYCAVEGLDRSLKQRKKRSLGFNGVGTPVPSTGEFLLNDRIGKNKELTDLATPTTNVSAFVRAVVNKIIPRQFLGTGDSAELNWKRFENSIDQFLNCKRFENVNLESVCCGIRIHTIDWLRPPKAIAGAKLSKSDYFKRMELLQELLYYIFDSIIIPLIRTNFYVTESSHHRNRLFFFRHDIWRLVTEPAMLRIRSSMYHEIHASKARKILEQRALGDSHLRLLPKRLTARAIVNLKRRPMMKTNGKAYLGASINSILKKAFSMLNYEKQSQPSLLGSAMFSKNELYSRLSSFKQELLPKGLADKELFLVKVDVQSCFDTIPQQALSSLIEDICQRESFSIKHHACVKAAPAANKHDTQRMTREKPTRRFQTIAHAQNASQTATFPELADKKYAGGKRNTVFVEGASQGCVDSEELLDILDDHINRNLVRIGKKYYRQSSGIAQGSVVSPLLCSFFYGDFESKRLSFIKNGNKSQQQHSALLRLIDDFFLVTTDQSVAERFLKIMLEGDSDYGIKVKPEKTLCNFVPDFWFKNPKLHVAERASPFPWCGAWISPKTLALTRDRSRSEHEQVTGQREGVRRTGKTHLRPDFADAVTTEAFKRPGASFYRKTLSAVRLNVRGMYLDTAAATAENVQEELHKGFTEVAEKAVRYLSRLKSLSHATRIKDSVIQKTIDGAAELAISVACQGKLTSSATKGHKRDVNSKRVEYLLVKAFLSSFQRQPTSYRKLIGLLKEREMSLEQDSYS